MGNTPESDAELEIILESLWYDGLETANGIARHDQSFGSEQEERKHDVSIALDKVMALLRKDREAVAREAYKMLKVQGEHGTWDIDLYNQGLYNGMEYMLALFENRDPQYREAPKKWIGWETDVAALNQEKQKGGEDE